jgi:HEAT repeat protein
VFAVSNLLVGVLVIVVCGLPARAADVADLIKKLGSDDSEVRRDAAQQLSELGKDAKPAVAALTKALKDPDRFVRRFAAQALGAIGPDAKSAIPGLGALVRDEQKAVRAAAVRALAQMGDDAVPALTKALQGGSPDVQELAITALAAAGKDGLTPLVAAIRDVKLDARLRRRAIEVVLPKGKAARAAVPALTDTVKTPRARGQEARQLRLDAIAALGGLATAADKAAVSTLDAIIKDEKLRDMGLKNAARQALKRIQARK